MFKDTNPLQNDARTQSYAGAAAMEMKQPTAISETENALRNLDAVVERLCTELVVLHSKLSPVLAESVPTTNKTEKVRPTCRSPLASKMQEAVNRIESILVRLNDLQDSCML